MRKLVVLINNEVVFDYDREISFAEEQLAFLDKMDNDMDKGIKIHGELLTNPDRQQRATFVVMNLIKALQQENDAVKMSSCAYLINRFPQLSEVHANDCDNTVKIELIEDEDIIEKDSINNH
jgi:hypothetical protein